MAINDRKVKQLNQPRHKSVQKLPALAGRSGMPQFLQDQIDAEQWNPTVGAKGGSDDLDDYEHILPIDKIDKMAASDFPGWSSLDEILLSIIRAHPNQAKSEEDRLKASKVALIGVSKKGPRYQDDHELLSAMASLYLRRIGTLEGTSMGLRAGALLSSVVDTDYWKNLNETQQIALRKRLRQKFTKNKDALLVEVTAFFHPAQKRRFEVTKEVIALLRKLQIVATPEVDDQDNYET